MLLNSLKSNVNKIWYLNFYNLKIIKKQGEKANKRQKQQNKKWTKKNSDNFNYSFYFIHLNKRHFSSHFECLLNFQLMRETQWIFNFNLFRFFFWAWCLIIHMIYKIYIFHFNFYKSERETEEEGEKSKRRNLNGNFMLFAAISLKCLLFLTKHNNSSLIDKISFLSFSSFFLLMKST